MIYMYYYVFMYACKLIASGSCVCLLCLTVLAINCVHYVLISFLPISLCDTLLGRLSVGCDMLDCSLRGGFLVPGLTEIAGTSAAGKTQLCLQLCLTVQLPRTHGGLDGGNLVTCQGFPNSSTLKNVPPLYISVAT